MSTLLSVVLFLPSISLDSLLMAFQIGFGVEMLGTVVAMDVSGGCIIRCSSAGSLEGVRNYLY